MEAREFLKEIRPYNLIRYVDSSILPTEWGTFALHGFVEPENQQEHVALTLGKWTADSAVLTRLHSECLTGDAFASMRCDCGYQLRKSLELIAKQGSGVLLYLRQEGRGIGLLNKIKAYHLQDDGDDTIEANLNLGLAADMRYYDFVEGMLSYLNVKKIRLLTNNPEKINALNNCNIEITERVPMVEGINPYNFNYVETKAMKMGHKIDIGPEGQRFRANAKTYN
ncbi:GTP cyclohydrolase II [Aliikangiella coralliicola]|nr:GTP cyclohydrolase II [Aliikangiella coralliicola]